MEPLIGIILTRQFGKVPRQEVPMWDWHSEEGRRFLDLVDAAVADGTDINEIGSLIGIKNFSQRYRMIRRGQ